MTNDSPDDNSTDFSNGTLCYQHDGQSSTQDVIPVDCVENLPPSKYLVIRIPGGKKILQLCEVEIRKFTSGMRVTLIRL